MTDLLAPVELTGEEVPAFLHHRVCWCGLSLATRPQAGKFIPVCPLHGDILPHQHVGAFEWAENHAGVLAAAVELRVLENESKPRQSEAGILKSLGF